MLTGFLIPGLATWSRRGRGAPVDTGTPVTFDAAATVAEDTADFAASLPFCPAAIAAAVAVVSFPFSDFAGCSTSLPAARLFLTAFTPATAALPTK